MTYSTCLLYNTYCIQTHTHTHTHTHKYKYSYDNLNMFVIVVGWSDTAGRSEPCANTPAGTVYSAPWVH